MAGGRRIGHADVTDLEGAVMKPQRALIFAGLLAGAPLALTACDEVSSLTSDAVRVSGSGTIVSETREVSGFARVVLAGEGDVIVTPGSGPSLEIETDDNLLPHVVSRVQGGELVLSTEEGIDLDPSGTVTYRIGVPAITGIELVGAGTLDVGRVETDRFEVLLAGAGNIRVDALFADRIDATLAGAGSISVSGEVDLQVVSLPGAGSYQAEDLQSTEVQVTSTGAVGATLWAVDRLDITATGTGSIHYYGHPTIDQTVTGTASIESRGDR